MEQNTSSADAIVNAGTARLHYVSALNICHANDQTRVPRRATEGSETLSMFLEMLPEVQRTANSLLARQDADGSRGM
jgi:hypothetical protein